jgi:hypothetical protein
MRVCLGRGTLLLGLLVPFAVSCASHMPGRHARPIAMESAMAASFGGASLRAEPAALFMAGLDENLDSIATVDELGAALDRLWVAADTDTSGDLSIHELNDWRQRWLGAADGWPGPFHFDIDGNSVIGRREFDAGLKAIFQEFDRNKDLRIERAELLAPALQRGKPPPAVVRQGGAGRDARG